MPVNLTDLKNEELAPMVAAGDRDAAEQLWQNCRKFIAMKARKYLDMNESFNGAALDDLMQQGYLALVYAAEAYNDADGFTFLTFLTRPLRTAFAEATGIRTSKVDLLNRDPKLERPAAISLDKPLIEGEEDGDCLIDVVPDRNTDVAGAVLDAMQYDELQQACKEVLEQLPAEQGEAIRLRYWEQMTFREIAEELDTDQYHARETCNKGIAKIRKTPRMKNRLDAIRLERELDELTNFYQIGSGLWRTRHERIVEEVAIMRERQRIQMEQTLLRNKRKQHYKNRRFLP